MDSFLLPLGKLFSNLSDSHSSSDSDPQLNYDSNTEEPEPTKKLEDRDIKKEEKLDPSEETLKKIEALKKECDQYEHGSEKSIQTIINIGELKTSIKDRNSQQYLGIARDLCISHINTKQTELQEYPYQLLRYLHQKGYIDTNDDAANYYAALGYSKDELHLCEKTISILEDLSKDKDSYHDTNLESALKLCNYWIHERSFPNQEISKLEAFLNNLLLLLHAPKIEKLKEKSILLIEKTHLKILIDIEENGFSHFRLPWIIKLYEKMKEHLPPDALTRIASSSITHQAITHTILICKHLALLAYIKDSSDQQAEIIIKTLLPANDQEILLRKNSPHPPHDTILDCEIFDNYSGDIYKLATERITHDFALAACISAHHNLINNTSINVSELLDYAKNKADLFSKFEVIYFTTKLTSNFNIEALLVEILNLLSITPTILSTALYNPNNSGIAAIKQITLNMILESILNNDKIDVSLFTHESLSNLQQPLNAICPNLPNGYLWGFMILELDKKVTRRLNQLKQSSS